MAAGVGFDDPPGDPLAESAPLQVKLETRVNPSARNSVEGSGFNERLGEETVVLSLPGVSGLLLSGHLRSVPRHSPLVELHREPVAEGRKQVELSDNNGEDPDRLAPFVTQSEHPNVLSSLPDGGGVPRPRNLLSGLDFPVTVEDLAHERADFRHENVNWGAG